MHEAYVVYPPATIAVHIESITSYENKVILGTRQGHLLMYAVDQNSNDNKMELQLMHYNKTFSDKPIVEIDVIPEYQLLYSLSNGQISVNDINPTRHNFPLVHRVQQTIKNAYTSLFALNVERSKTMSGGTGVIVRMCSVVKRKLQLWFWKQDKFITFAQDIDLIDVPKAVLWHENIICIGFRTEYMVYDISGDQPKKYDLFPTSSLRGIDPCMALINDCVAVAKDEYVIAVDPKEKSLQEPAGVGGGSVTGNTSTGLGSSGSATTIISNAAVVKKAMEGEQLKLFKSLIWSQNVQVLVWDAPYIIGLINNALEIRILDKADSKQETFIQTLPDLNKARFISRSKRGMAFVASNNQLWCIQAVDIQKQRQNLLEQKQFHLALELTEVSDESEEEKREKKHEIGTRYAFDLFVNKMFKESMDEFGKLEKTNVCDVIRLFPNLLANGGPAAAVGGGSGNTNINSYTSSVNLPKLDGRDLENGLLALIDYLISARFKIKFNLQSIGSSGSTPVQSKQYEKNANSLLSIIDTTLLKCYLPTNDSLVAPLLRLNCCHFEESEKTLKQYDKLNELIILYKYKGRHRKALELLQIESEKPNSSLAGPELTISYLQHLGNENKSLIFEFSGWILEKHPEEGLKIFTDDITEIELLSRAEVLDFLLKNHKSLVIPYLEHIINVWNEPKPLFHNYLIQQYEGKIKQYKLELLATNTATIPASNLDTGAASSSPTKKLIEKPKAKILLDSTRNKLFDFLKTSDKYSPDCVLKYFPSNDLFEERAIILGKLGMHEKVIAIYIHILGDLDHAADYCESVYNESVATTTSAAAAAVANNATTKPSNIYVQLIKTLLIPPKEPPYSDVPLHPKCLQPNIEFVLELLQRHATKINTHAVLSILPDKISLFNLRTFLELALHHQLERRRKNQVLKGLLYAENVQAQEERMHEESKSILVTEFTVCPVCKKKFSNQSAFVRYANGNIVHYSCQEKELKN